jgi:hypothetical protein
MNKDQLMQRVVNTTPHPITFDWDGEAIVIPPSEMLINARMAERIVAERDGVAFVATVFEPDPETEAKLRALKAERPNAIIVGSVIAAQAYPGLVVGMTPMPGFERVPPDQKRMNPRKFSVFGSPAEDEAEQVKLFALAWLKARMAYAFETAFSQIESMNCILRDADFPLFRDALARHGIDIFEILEQRYPSYPWRGSASSASHEGGQG